MKRLLLAALFLGFSAAASAQLDVQKVCPATVAHGGTVTCNFTVTNNFGTGEPVRSLSVTNIFPFPGGPETAVPCYILGSPTTIIPDGQSCTGSFTETADATNDCSGSVQDYLHAIGQILSFGTVEGVDQVAITVTGAPACTPTPTTTPAATPTPYHFNLTVIKSCPGPTVPAGGNYTCTFSVQNQDPFNSVTDLHVYDLFGTLITPVSCFWNGAPVAALAARGQASDTCTGSVVHVAPACSTSSVQQCDAIQAAATDAGCNGGAGCQATGISTACVTVAACTTPTPGGPTFTPTLTPTVTPTFTFTVTGTPPTSTPTLTPTNTPTSIGTPNSTRTPFPTGSATATNTATVTPTRTPTPTSTVTPTATATAIPCTSLTALTGQVHDAADNAVTVNGRVWFALNQNGNAISPVGPFSIAPGSAVSFKLTNGVIAANSRIVPQECISPSGTFYKETVVDRAGGIVLRKNVVIHGTTADIGTLPAAPSLP